MKSLLCRKCDLNHFSEIFCPKIRRVGRYYRTSDSSWVQRYYCCGCKTKFSSATFSSNYRQRKRRKNKVVVRLLCSGVSQRRAAKLTSLSRTTVARILRREYFKAEFALRQHNLEAPKASLIQFDDLETFEHSKCKPISISLAVEEGSRRILGVEVSSMAAKGHLAKKAKVLHGKRLDGRAHARANLFKKLIPLISGNAVIKSDENPYYPGSIKKYLPTATHITVKGKRGAITGQGELKKIGFDPIFSLNHTCAMLRANVNRLFRKTWCTTKKMECLYAHLVLYADYHNRYLLEPALPT